MTAVVTGCLRTHGNAVISAAVSAILVLLMMFLVVVVSTLALGQTTTDDLSAVPGASSPSWAKTIIVCVTCVSFICGGGIAYTFYTLPRVVAELVARHLVAVGGSGAVSNLRIRNGAAAAVAFPFKFKFSGMLALFYVIFGSMLAAKSQSTSLFYGIVAGMIGGVFVTWVLICVFACTDPETAVQPSSLATHIATHSIDDDNDDEADVMIVPGESV